MLSVTRTKARCDGFVQIRGYCIITSRQSWLRWGLFLSKAKFRLFALLWLMLKKVFFVTIYLTLYVLMPTWNCGSGNCLLCYICDSFEGNCIGSVCSGNACMKREAYIDGNCSLNFVLFFRRYNPNCVHF